jgi:transposase
MEIFYAVCCGLDVHAKTVVACLIVSGKKTTRTFSTMTEDLLQLADWLLEAGCTHVAMESTGVYWKPVHTILEGVCEVLLVNAQHVKQVPGRKTDVKDCEWLADLLRHGLLKASFIPPAPIRDLRELTRYRSTLVRDRVQLANRVQKLAESGNIKLSQVLSNALGVSGRRMLRALAEGEQDLDRIVGLADERLYAKHGELRRAVDGRLTQAQRFVLADLLDRYDEVERAIARVSERVAEEVGSEQQDPFVEEAMAKLDEMTGIGQRIAEVIIAEIGIDMGRFPSEKHLSKWAGLAPGNNASGGRRRSGRTTKGNQALRTALVQAAWVAVRKKESYFGVLYGRWKGRLGSKRAIIAVAHRMLEIIYHMLSRREGYHEVDLKAMGARSVEYERERLVRKLTALGVNVTIEERADIPDAA